MIVTFEQKKEWKNSHNKMEFEANLFQEIKSLSLDLKNQTYKPSRSICFYFEKPKLREVIAAHFRDRVVHRYLYDRLEPLYERSFIADSYACRKGKGTYACVDKYKQCFRSGTRNAKAPLYYLQLDIKGYFYVTTIFVGFHKTHLSAFTRTFLSQLTNVILQTDGLYECVKVREGYGVG